MTTKCHEVDNEHMMTSGKEDWYFAPSIGWQ